MNKLPRTDVIDQQAAVVAEETKSGDEVTSEELAAVQGGLVLRPIYGVPKPLPEPPKPPLPKPPFDLIAKKD